MHVEESQVQRKLQRQLVISKTLTKQLPERNNGQRSRETPGYRKNPCIVSLSSIVTHQKLANWNK